MMETLHRRIVECIKASKGMQITINPSDRKNRLTLDLREDRKLAHDVALALQTYFINNNS